MKPRDTQSGRSMKSDATVRIGGLREIASAYDGYLVDPWGTVHNGVAPLHGAPECLAALKQAGKRVCLLSNAPPAASPVDRKRVVLGKQECVRVHPTGAHIHTQQT